MSIFLDKKIKRDENYEDIPVRVTKTDPEKGNPRLISRKTFTEILENCERLTNSIPKRFQLSILDGKIHFIETVVVEEDGDPLDYSLFPKVKYRQISFHLVLDEENLVIWGQFPYKYES